jgi:hypothetical protein
LSISHINTQYVDTEWIPIRGTEQPDNQRGDIPAGRGTLIFRDRGTGLIQQAAGGNQSYCLGPVLDLELFQNGAQM